jgi:hypothetical protein
MRKTMVIDAAQIALDLINRSTPRGEGDTRETIRAVLEADYTEDAEQVNGFGVYSVGRDAMLAAAEKAAIANKTAGIDSRVVSANQLADNVILAHVLSSANVPERPFARSSIFGSLWSSSTPVILGKLDRPRRH